MSKRLMVAVPAVDAVTEASSFSFWSKIVMQTASAALLPWTATAK